MVRNEETKLPAGLQSAADLVDETIVVDTGSTDGTRDLAARLGARVFEFPWRDDFAAARNECIRHARGDFIFWMDADERVDEVNRQKLKGLFKNLSLVIGHSSFVPHSSLTDVEPRTNDQGQMTNNHSPLTNTAFVMKCLSVQPGETRQGTVVDHVRVFRNRPEHRWRYRVHEQILPALKTTGTEIRWTDIVIHHVGYQDAATTRRKLERNLRLLQLDQAQHPDEPYILFNLGWALLELGAGEPGCISAGEPGCVSARSGPADAIPYLQRSLQLSHPADSIVKKLWALLAVAHQRLGQIEPALAACQMGRVRNPGDAELLFREGQLLAATGNVDAAMGCFRRLVSGQKITTEITEGTEKTEEFSSVSSVISVVKSFGSTEVGYTGYLARHELALLYHRKGMDAEVEAEWRAVVEEQPEHLPAWLGLGELYLRQANWAELDRVVETLMGGVSSPLSVVSSQEERPLTTHNSLLTPSQEEGQVLRARGMLARKEFDPAKSILREVARRNPGWVHPRIILSHVLLQEGKDESTAEQVLREVVDLDPSQAESWRNLAVLYRHQGLAAPVAPASRLAQAGHATRLAQAAAVCRSARVHCPHDPDLLLLQGIVLREMGDLINAESCLLGVISRTEFNSIPPKTRERIIQARHNLALVFVASGRLAEAEGQWREVLAECPDYAPARAGLEELQQRTEPAGLASAS
jgi:tetratricopeptide (TPR) repeat protein